MPPKGIGYQDASKLSSFRRKKSKDEEALKGPRFNPATEKVIRGYIQSGFTREEAVRKVDKAARKAAEKRSR